VILPLDCAILGIADSKTLTPRARERLYAQICGGATAWATGVVSSDFIDAHNIRQATYAAMRAAVAGLKPPADFALIDGLPVTGLDLPHASLIDGDQHCCSIAAASIIAKVMRDALMRELGCLYEGYGFEQHKGYGTREHLAALRKLGPCPIHRRSFAPVLASAQLLLEIDEQRK
jgi:ribonuclease HII